MLDIIICETFDQIVEIGDQSVLELNRETIDLYNSKWFNYIDLLERTCTALGMRRAKGLDNGDFSTSDKFRRLQIGEKTDFCIELSLVNYNHILTDSFWAAIIEYCHFIIPSFSLNVSDGYIEDGPYYSIIIKDRSVFIYSEDDFSFRLLPILKPLLEIDADQSKQKDTNGPAN